MRRMISETLMQKIKRLFKSVWSDDEGNVEVGKNLEVDGDLTLNSIQNIKDSKGKPLLPVFKHTVQVLGTRPAQGGGGRCFFVLQGYSKSNTPIDSYLDLSTLLGGDDYLVSGFYSPSEGTQYGALYVDLHGGSILTDKIVCSDPSITGPRLFKLNECGTLSFSDDVSLPNKEK